MKPREYSDPPDPTPGRWWERLVARLERFHSARRAKTIRVGDGYRASEIDVPGERPAYLARIEQVGRYLDLDALLRIRVRRAGAVGLAVMILTGLVTGAYYLFATRDANAVISETRWTYHVGMRARQINHGSDWHDRMHAHAFDVSCTIQVRGHHLCNPHQCNRHQESYDCRCRTTTSRSGRNRSSRTSCSTCYRTVYDTCWDSCTDYDSHCEYQYPSWPQTQERTLVGNDHLPVRPPDLIAVGGQTCITDDEALHDRGFDECTWDTLAYAVQFDAHETGHWTIAPPTLSEYDRYQHGAHWHVQYNHAGMFRPVAPSR